MHESDRQRILKQFDEAIALTDMIVRLLQTGNIDEADSIYNQREPVLKTIAEYKTTDADAFLDQEFLRQWNAKSGELTDKDQTALQLIADMRDELQEQLRETFKRKDLLIYSKG